MGDSYWPEREYEAPDERSLWDKSHVARRPHLCSLCGEEIPVGAKYRSLGYVTDGEFGTMKMHGGGFGSYPSDCPRFNARDRDEIAAQFEADREEFFPAENPAQGVALGRQGNLPPEHSK